VSYNYIVFYSRVSKLVTTVWIKAKFWNTDRLQQRWSDELRKPHFSGHFGKKHALIIRNIFSPYLMDSSFFPSKYSRFFG
jgi:hypothetical protein